MNQKMLDLIDTVIGDGELEQEEIDYLKEKATEYGESPIEVVSLAKTMLKKQLDEKKSEELNYQRKIEAEEKKHQRKENFEGEVKKCPHCGEVINALSKTCAACGKLISVDEIRDLMNNFEYSLSYAEGYMDNTKSHINSFNECIGTARKYLRQLKASYGNREDVINWIIGSEKEIKRVEKLHYKTVVFPRKKALIPFICGAIVTLIVACVGGNTYINYSSDMTYGMLFGALTAVIIMFGAISYSDKAPKDDTRSRGSSFKGFD